MGGTLANQYILAIDQGTSGTKALLFSEAGSLAASAFAPLRCMYPRHQYVEQDPEEIYASVIAAVRDAVEQSGISAEAIAACGISNQRETFLLWDADGKPLCNAIVWSCKRSIGVCEALRESGAEPLVRRTTGLTIDPYFSGTKLLHLRQNDAALEKRIAGGNVHFGTVDAYLLYRLTGSKAYCTDYTNASRTLLFDIAALKWNDELLRLFGAENLKLPQPRPSASLFGESNFEGALAAARPITGMIGDSQGALLGHGCYQNGFAKATMGTGSSIMMNAGRSPVQNSRSLMSVICYATSAHTHYGLEGVIVSCGSMLEWLKEKARLFASYEEAHAVLAAHTSDGVMVVPGFAGLGSPYWNAQAKGEIRGLTFSTSPENIIRAAYEAVAFQICSIVDAIRDEHGISLQGLQLDGGLAKNAVLVQMLADLLPATVRVPEVTYLSGWGAALCAGMGIGLWAEDALPSIAAQTRAYKRAENASLTAAYGAWTQVMNQFIGT